jgi:dihydropteroate synthase
MDHLDTRPAGPPPRKRPIRGRGFTLEPERQPLIMGILNVTPDSFSDGGAYFGKDEACRRAMEMVEAGADIIDIGGESTRPGAKGVGPVEEIRRIVPVIESLAGQIPVPMSVDTRRAVVARAALGAGCGMVNDVSALSDPEMAAVVREFGASIVLMHMKGSPETMQDDPHYDDPVNEVRDFLRERAEYVRRLGIDDDMIYLDPGIGFGKRFRDNLELLRSIGEIQNLGYPVVVGASRKRFLGDLLRAEPLDRLSGSLAVAAWCSRNFVDILRVHDVKETSGLFRVLDAIDHPADFSADR